MTDRVEQEKPEKLKKSSWWWPGVVASSLAGVAVSAFRRLLARQDELPDRRAGIFIPGFAELWRQAAVRRENLLRLLARSA
jgi:hypothetical protein